ncbi:hypothetical protein BV25DRAFT_1705989 [Artomyces pyxidatus]|uniref:Uncharacterized protein n=1 Tax=Artomyces pyxidatus TaxID=48021 RepID=A0ACB8TAJ5_9AGAM|nr:hypothetical protein BV25DRAFT_1705989 [Artomyces pyxidatus]
MQAANGIQTAQRSRSRSRDSHFAPDVGPRDGMATHDRDYVIATRAFAISYGTCPPTWSRPVHATSTSRRCSCPVMSTNDVPRTLHHPVPRPLSSRRTNNNARLPLPLLPPRPLFGTPFDPSPRFEYPFPSPTLSLDDAIPESPPFSSSAISPPFAPSKFSVSLPPFRFIRPPPLPTRSSSSSSMSYHYTSSPPTSTATSTTGQSPRCSPLLSPSQNQNPKAAVAASARDPPIPPALKRRRLFRVVAIPPADTPVRS